MAQQGTVKWFNKEKGYGFIAPSNGGQDVFVHITAVLDAGMQNLQEGDSISFELAENRGKVSAVQLQKVA